MNFLALEGPTGAGKTTLVRALQRRLPWPVYRPFRGLPDEHTPGTTEPGLKKLGVPVNTWMEDLFTADLLAVAKSHVILDRSMPSALAYDELGLGLGLTSAQRIDALELWARRVARGGGSIVVMVAPVQVCQRRSGRFTLEHVTHEDVLIRTYVSLAQAYGVRVLEVSTDDGSDTEANADTIAAMAGR